MTMTDTAPATPAADDLTRPEPSTESSRPEPAEAALKSPAPELEPSTDLVPDMSRGAMLDTSIDARIRYAKELAAAGLLPSHFRQNPGNVLYAVEFGNMLGIHPLAAITGVHVMDGKPTASPALMSALVRRAGHKLRVRVTGTVENGDLAVTATLVRSDDPDEPFTATWTLKRAQRGGLVDSYLADAETGEYVVRSRTSKGNPSTWEKYPEAMCKARAIGEVCREGAEEALCGVHYTPEELGVQVDADGVVIVETTLAEPSEPDVSPAEQLALAVESLRKRIAATTTLEQLEGYYRQAAARPDAAELAAAETHDHGVICTVTELFAAQGRRLKGGESGSGGAERPAPEPDAPETPSSEAQADSVDQDAAPADPYAAPISQADIVGEAPAEESNKRTQPRDEREAEILGSLDESDAASWRAFGRREPYVGEGAYGAIASAELDDDEAISATAHENTERAERLRTSVAAWHVQARLDEHVEAEPVPARKLASSRPRAAMIRNREGL